MMLNVHSPEPSHFEYEEYRGTCDEWGRRSGQGTNIWDHYKEQLYDGELLADTFHGNGTYLWERGSKRTVYEGTFYCNHKEGYGLVSFPNGTNFEGLFHSNIPFGPGVMTYANGRQDVGLWLGNKIVRLSRVVDFIIPRLSRSAKAKIKLLQFRRVIPITEEESDLACEMLLSIEASACLQEAARLYSNEVLDERSIFFRKHLFDKTFFRNINDLYQEFNIDLHELDSTPVYSLPEVVEEEEDGKIGPLDTVHEFIRQNIERVDIGDLMTGKERYQKYEMSEEYLGEAEEEEPIGILNYFTSHGSLTGILENVTINVEGDEEQLTDSTVLSSVESVDAGPPITHLLAWNRSSLSCEILKQIFRYRNFEEQVSFRVARILTGIRTKFRKTGYKEKECIEFLRLCATGPGYEVREYLNNHGMSVELTDARGNNGLMFAVACDQHDVIDVLLDYGVNVNCFNDENLTPLNICILRKIALVNKFKNWEEIFLPPNEYIFTSEDMNIQEWRKRISIESLDRFFGDGLSIDKSVIAMKTELLKIQCRREMELWCVNGEDNTDDMNDDETDISVEERRNIFRTQEYEDSIREGDSKLSYFFDVKPTPPPPPPGKKKGKKPPREKKNKKKKGEETPATPKEELPDMDLIKKLEKVDATIQKLLQRGADPNLCDVPKPALHMAVHNRDARLVKLLLVFEANPNILASDNDDKLTPLHLVAGLKPCEEMLTICEDLLNYGANPELETSSAYSYSEREFLKDERCGQTPLHLLCLRPDANYADPNEVLPKIAATLACWSKPRHFYKGHSPLTLAMLSGNLNIMKALLDEHVMNPNQILGKETGCPLFVLLSTFLQQRTVLENSLKMFYLLLEAGANPLTKLNMSEMICGSCLEYGKSEIEREKQRRLVEKKGKGAKKSKKKKKEKDFLQDHIEFIEHFESVVSEYQEKEIEPTRWKKTCSKYTNTKGTESGMINEIIKKADSKNSQILDPKREAMNARRDDMFYYSKKANKLLKLQEEKSKKGSETSCAPCKCEIKFPEKHRRSLLKMYTSTCGLFNIDELLASYVVFRNGDMYYRFYGKPSKSNENYSLI